jgi:hypothetical protein
MFEKHKAAKLEAAQARQAIGEVRARASQLPDSDGAISIEAFQQFMQYVSEHNVEFGSIPEVRTAIRLGLSQGGYFLQTDTTLLLKKGESALLESGADLLKEVTDREFRGASNGVSVPLGHGIRYRTGAVRGHMVTIGTHWATADTGALTVTDQRIVYHGGRKTLEFLFTKLATLNAYTDAIDLGVTNRQATSSFRVGDPELVAGIIHAAVNHRDSDVTIVQLEADADPSSAIGS